MSWTGMAAGAAEGLDRVLARHLQQVALDRQDAALKETTRHNQADEQARGRQLDIQQAQNEAQNALTTQLRNQQLAKELGDAQEKEANRLRGMLTVMPIGTAITPQEYADFTTKAGAPAGMFKPQTHLTGDDGSQPVPTGSYTYSGSGGEQHAATTEELGQLRAEIARQSAMMGNQLGLMREQRMREWGPPTATVFDPNSPTRVSVVSRPDAVGKAGPEPSGQRTQITTNDSAIAQLENLNQLHENIASHTGPVEGRLREASQVLPLFPTDKDWAAFSAASANIKNATIRAITGAVMNKDEAARIMSQIPLPTDKPEVWVQKYAQLHQSLGNLERAASGTPQPMPSHGATPAAPLPGTPKRQIQSGRFVIEEQ